ncbi:hypothetical protein PG995_008494 [Apiospora arundinis]
MALSAQSRDRLSRLPTELKLEIFLNLSDAPSVFNLSLASKGFRNILEDFYPTIVRTLVSRLVPPECTKLAVMAIASQSVDPNDNDDLQNFFDEHMNHSELADDQLELKVANGIPSLHHTIVTLQSQGMHSTLFRLAHISPNVDPMRLIQFYYAIKIVSNLFPISSSSSQQQPKTDVLIRWLPHLTHLLYLTS